MRFRPLIFAAILVCSLAACSGSCEFPYEALVAAVPADASEAVPALRVSDDGPGGRVFVYVDLSLTMRPFLQGVQPAQTPYYGLLEQLSNDLGGDISFHGFGLRPGAEAQSIDDLGGVSAVLSVDAYDRLNNDYAGLFQRFVPDSGAVALDAPTRIVLTDGVESDAESGRRYGGVVAAVDEWIRAGGAFAAFAIRSPYDGRYYAESTACAGAEFGMVCADRPVIAFVFAPDEGRIVQIEAALAAGGVEAEYGLLVGGRSEYDLQPVAEVAVADQRRPERLLRDVDTVYVDNTQPFVSARIAQQAVDKDGFYPLTVAAAAPPSAAWTRLPAQQRALFLNSLRPEVRAWAVEDAGQDVEGRDSVALHPVGVVEKTGAATVVVDAEGGVRVTVPVQRPVAPNSLRRVRQFAWLVTLTPYETAPLLVPAALSTTADCGPDRCSQVLNLGPMLGAILRDDYVPGRAFFLTEWSE